MVGQRTLNPFILVRIQVQQHFYINMKKQILVIHGGNAYDSYDEFISSLKKKEIDLEKMKLVGWKTNLFLDLGNEFEVLNPKMPNSQNAKYSEWKIYFERIIPHLNDELILIGHSLGGTFLAKYLSENNFSKKIKALILIAPPFNTPTKHPLADFILIRNLDNLKIQVEKIILFHSKDDKVVPYPNSKHYMKQLRNAELVSFENKGHFTEDHFPELVEIIKNI